MTRRAAIKTAALGALAIPAAILRASTGAIRSGPGPEVWVDYFAVVWAARKFSYASFAAIFNNRAAADRLMARIKRHYGTDLRLCYDYALKVPRSYDVHFVTDDAGIELL